MKCKNCGDEMIYAYGFIWHYYYCGSCGNISHPLDVFKRIKRYEVKNRGVAGERGSGMSYRDFSELENAFAVYTKQREGGD